MTRSVTLIYNPTAGRLRRDPELLERLALALQDRGLTVTLAPTERAHHAAELARAAVQREADCVLVLGGDGTINEAAQGVIGSRAALAFYPGGTANVFAKELN
ncbi:MAG: acylglycerol kinase family protein, partial [Acidobacteria bacterium]|nr:acylglycerol kinase family protein [Acidobacteriota bacterium]